MWPPHAIDQLGKPELLALAAKLGIDAKAIITDVVVHGKGLASVFEEEELALWNYSHRWPAFKGALEFDLTFELLGKKVTRKAKLKYVCTPEWQYFDLQKRAPFVGWPGVQSSIHLLAVPEEFDEDGNMTLGEPHWVEMEDLIQNDVLPHEIWDAVIDAIDDKCKAEDAERRRIAAVGKPRRNHKPTRR